MNYKESKQHHHNRTALDMSLFRDNKPNEKKVKIQLDT